MEEVVIFLDNQSGSHRVKEFENPCQQENQPDDQGAEPSEPVME